MSQGTANRVNKTLSSVQVMKALGSLQADFAFGRSRLGKQGLCYRKVLPLRRHWPVIALVGVLQVVLAVPLIAALARTTGASEDLFDLTFSMFHFFWALGWSVGVITLLLIFLALLLAREVLLASRDGIEIHMGVFGIGISAIYAPNRLSRLEVVETGGHEGDSWRGGHLRFRYLDVPIAVGSSLDAADCSAIIKGIEHGLGFRVPQELSLSVQYQQEQASKTAAVHLAARDQEEAGQALLAQQKRDAIQPVRWNSPSGLLLILANLVPLGGVLWFGWQTGELFLLYWMESAIIGLFNVARMAVIGKWAALFTGVFFIAHFGGFMIGHLLFIYTFFVQSDASTMVPLAEVSRQFALLWPAILALVCSHGFSFFSNFIGHKEYVGRTLSQQMGEPYGRIIIMHLTIIFGGFLVMLLGYPMLSLVLLIVMKLAADLKAHVRQHKITPES